MTNIAATRLLLAGLLAAFAAAAGAQDVKIGVVDIVRIEKESPMSIRAGELLKQEFEPRGLQLQEYQKQINATKARFEKERDKLSPTDAQARERDLLAMMRKSDQATARFTEELEARRGELRGRVIEETRAAIKVVAESGKFDLILQEAAFARPTVDITPLVLKEMAKRGNVLK